MRGHFATVRRPRHHRIARHRKGSVQSGPVLLFMAPGPSVPGTCGPTTGVVDRHAGLRNLNFLVSLQRQIVKLPVGDDAGPGPFEPWADHRSCRSSRWAQDHNFLVSLQRQIVELPVDDDAGPDPFAPRVNRPTCRSSRWAQKPQLLSEPAASDRRSAVVLSLLSGLGGDRARGRMIQPALGLATGA